MSQQKQDESSARSPSPLTMRTGRISPGRATSSRSRNFSDYVFPSSTFEYENQVQTTTKFDKNKIKSSIKHKGTSIFNVFENATTEPIDKRKINPLTETKKAITLKLSGKEQMTLYSFKDQILNDNHYSPMSTYSSTFIDCYFPPSDISIVQPEFKHKVEVPFDDIYWLRIPQIFSEKKIEILDEEFNQQDCVSQGWIKDSNLICTFISLGQKVEYIKKLFYEDKESESGQYKIILLVKGVRTIVVIDDYFPCLKGTRCPLFAKAHSFNIWPMLLEKAFAKVFGSYYSLQSITVDEALSMLIPFPVVKHNFECRTVIWNIIQSSMATKKVNIARIEGIGNDSSTLNGLLPFSSYLVDKTWEGMCEGKYIRLVKMKFPIIDMRQYEDTYLISPKGRKMIKRLPFNNCNSYSWKGKFAFDDPNWTINLMESVGDFNEKEKDEGFFWMDYEQFFLIFSSIYSTEIKSPTYTVFCEIKKTIVFYKIFLNQTAKLELKGDRVDFMILTTEGEYVNRENLLSKGEYIIFAYDLDKGALNKNIIINSNEEFMVKPVSSLNNMDETASFIENIIDTSKGVTKTLDGIEIITGFEICNTSLGYAILRNKYQYDIAIDIKVDCQNCYQITSTLSNNFFINKNGQTVILFGKIQLNHLSNIDISLVNVRKYISKRAIKIGSDFSDPRLIMWKRIISTQRPNVQIYDSII